MEPKNSESESVSAMKIGGALRVVTKRPGYIKVNMDGVQGWKSVWAADFPGLLERVKLALVNKQ